MGKILSVHIDEEAAILLDALSRRLHKTKKKILEEALREYAARGRGEPPLDVLKETWGAWSRNESATETVRRARSAFRNSVARRSR